VNSRCTGTGEEGERHRLPARGSSEEVLLCAEVITSSEDRVPRAQAACLCL